MDEWTTVDHNVKKKKLIKKVFKGDVHTREIYDECCRYEIHVSSPTARMMPG